MHQTLRKLPDSAICFSGKLGPSSRFFSRSQQDLHALNQSPRELLHLSSNSSFVIERVWKSVPSSTLHFVIYHKLHSSQAHAKVARCRHPSSLTLFLYPPIHSTLQSSSSPAMLRMTGMCQRSWLYLQHLGPSFLGSQIL